MSQFDSSNSTLPSSLLNNAEHSAEYSAEHIERNTPRNIATNEVVAGDFDEIPVVNIAGLYSEDLGDRMEVAQALKQAAQQVGFLYVTGHQVSLAATRDMQRAAKHFFDQPLEAKMRSYIGFSENHSGYVPKGEEQFYGSQNTFDAPDNKEAYDLGFDYQKSQGKRPMLGPNLWPKQAGFKEAVSDYYEQVLALGRRLFSGFALALGLDEDYFVPFTKQPPSQLRLIHYPYDAKAKAEQGIGAHTDYECFTLLLTTADGLQVQNGRGEWIDAPHKPDCFVVNIGDMLETLSNGRFKATVHRVQAVAQERYSFPLFCSLDYDATVAPVMPPLPQSTKRYRSRVCGEHLYRETILTFRYLQARLERGEIKLPD